jgi:hypothetical protein
VVELQWRQLLEMEIGKGRRWGAIIFGGEEGEEVRQLHGASGEQHNEEQRGDRGGRRRWLAS